MCGIVGYIGKKQAAPILLDGLSKLEYRGYDSAGMAIFDGKKINMAKATGRLKVLSELTHEGATLPGTVGIGHTRWALITAFQTMALVMRKICTLTRQKFSGQNI